MTSTDAAAEHELGRDDDVSSLGPTALTAIEWVVEKRRDGVVAGHSDALVSGLERAAGRPVSTSVDLRLPPGQHELEYERLLRSTDGGRAR